MLKKSLIAKLLMSVGLLSVISGCVVVPAHPVYREVYSYDCGPEVVVAPPVIVLDSSVDITEGTTDTTVDTAADTATAGEFSRGFV